MSDLVRRAMDDLNKYSLMVGKRPELRGTPEAVVMLPPDLARQALAKASEPARRWLESEIGEGAAVSVEDVAAHVLVGERQRYGTRDLMILSMTLGSFGYGMEPDPRLAEVTVPCGERIVVFRLSSASSDAEIETPAYRLAMVMALIMAGIAQADGVASSVSAAVFAKQLQASLKLSDIQSQRLQAHLTWLRGRKVALSSIRKALATVPEESRRDLARFAAGIAVVDGCLGKAESAVVERIYGDLGVPRETMFSDLHELTARRVSPATEPVPVLVEGVRATGFRIPRPPEQNLPGPGAASGQGLSLDPSLINAILEDSAKVSAVLEEIFRDDDQVPRDDGEPEAALRDQGYVSGGPPPARSPQVPGFEGLDDRHSALLSDVLAAGHLSRQMFEDMARGHGLMADGAIDTLNEWALDRFDDSILDDGPEITVNSGVLGTGGLGAAQ